jgi:virginiamycin B lyase
LTAVRRGRRRARKSQRPRPRRQRSCRSRGWNSGDLFRYDSKSKSWARWHLPGDGPQPYAVYVDETDAVWVSDWSANAILRFDPKTEKFEAFPLPDRYAGVRQLAGRKGEVWGAESRADKLFVVKTE